MGVKGRGSANDVISKELVNRGSFLSRQTSEERWKERRVCSVKNFVPGFIVAILILPIGCLAYFALGFSQTRADAKPSALETVILQWAVRASVRRSAANIPKPPPATAQPSASPASSPKK